jgi:prephenate dehydratase
MALLQCEEFLATHPAMRALEAADTAESARDIQREQARGHAAIASRLAAEAYGLELLAEGIETNKRNYTRFLVIGRSEGNVPDPRANKASIRFEVADRPGCLAKVLGDFSELGVNMTKIQSVPILGRPYEYSFHVDLEWEDRGRYDEAMRRVRQDVINLIHFGEYVRSERPTQ